MVTKLNPYYFTFNVITNQFIPREFNSDNSGKCCTRKIKCYTFDHDKSEFAERLELLTEN